MQQSRMMKAKVKAMAAGRETQMEILYGVRAFAHQGTICPSKKMLGSRSKAK